MKRNDGFVLKELAGVSYLLPCGQLIADHRRGISLNETGVLIWNLLRQEQTWEQLLSRYLEHLPDMEDYKEELEADLKQFLRHLASYRMLEWDNSEQSGSLPLFCTLKIGGLSLQLKGPSYAFSSAFDSFTQTESSSIDQTISIHSTLPPRQFNGQLLVRNDELMICEHDRHFLLLFPKNPQIREAHLAKDGSSADFYCLPPFTEDFRSELFHAIRLPFLYLAQLHGMVVLHSASILYRQKAWLFSGPSGTGKSTHTNLWNRLLDTPILNGDLNLLAFSDGKPIIHGLPWCGTSGLAALDSHPLGGIVLLKQAKEDACLELAGDKKQLMVMQRFISPSWTEKMLDRNLHAAAQLSSCVPVFQLQCTKEPSAVHAIKTQIDLFMNHEE
ncbi:MAG: PqqD family protein [Lachnospiraceae bacterium]|nr:PqqD family protein [Lachnospiraceae bacterium]